jgi:integrase
MPWFNLACQLTYRCFIRPNELVCLKVSDVDLENGTVTIQSEHGKTGKKRLSILPYSIWDQMKELNLAATPGHFHVFSGLDYRPGLKRSCEHRIGRYFSKYIRPVLGFDNQLVFYSLKDTGITHFLQRGGSIGDAQYQAGHSKAAMTAQYIGTNKATIEALRQF